MLVPVLHWLSAAAVASAHEPPGHEPSAPAPLARTPLEKPAMGEAQPGRRLSEVTYYVGTQGTNSCGGDPYVDTATDCQTASVQLEDEYPYGYQSSGNYGTGYPRGCFVFSTSGFYFNNDEVGGPQASSRPVCEIASPSPPPFPFFPICCDTDFTNGVPSGWTAIDSATNQAIGLSTTVCGSFGSILGGHAARPRLDIFKA